MGGWAEAGWTKVTFDDAVPYRGSEETSVGWDEADEETGDDIGLQARARSLEAVLHPPAGVVSPV